MHSNKTLNINLDNSPSKEGFRLDVLYKPRLQSLHCMLHHMLSRCNGLNVLTRTESTAGKSLLQLTASPVSCFHTSPGRANTYRSSQRIKPLNPPIQSSQRC